MKRNVYTYRSSQTRRKYSNTDVSLTCPVLHKIVYGMEESTQTYTVRGRTKDKIFPLDTFSEKGFFSGL